MKSRPFGQQFDLLGADVGLARALPDVDDRRLRRDLHRLGHARQRQREVDLLDLAERHAHVHRLPRHEALEVRGHLVVARRQGGETECAQANRYVVDATGPTLDTGFNRGARKHRARGIPHDALDRAALFLREAGATSAASSNKEREVLKASPSSLKENKRQQKRSIDGRGTPTEPQLRAIRILALMWLKTGRMLYKDGTNA